MRHKVRRHKIIADIHALEQFIEGLPEEKNGEVYFMSLMARSKEGELPSVKNCEIHGTKRICKKADIVRTIHGYEIPAGLYTRKGVEIRQSHLCPYITVNPRSLTVAAKATAINLTTSLLNGQPFVDPVAFSFTEIHKAIGTKHFVDFDFDGVRFEDLKPKIDALISGYRVLTTKGGFHLICPCHALGSSYNEIVKLGCDVHGSHGMIPIPGCYQRGFVPFFLKSFIMEL